MTAQSLIELVDQVDVVLDVWADSRREPESRHYAEGAFPLSMDELAEIRRRIESGAVAVGDILRMSCELYGKPADCFPDDASWALWQHRQATKLHEAIQKLRTISPERLDEYQRNSDMVPALMARIEALERDAARLDWLADPDNMLGSVGLPKECVEANVHSMREAIDMAMAIDAAIAGREG